MKKTILLGLIVLMASIVFAVEIGDTLTQAQVNNLNCSNNIYQPTRNISNNGKWDILTVTTRNLMDNGNSTYTIILMPPKRLYKHDLRVFKISRQKYGLANTVMRIWLNIHRKEAQIYQDNIRRCENFQETNEISIQDLISQET